MVERKTAVPLVTPAFFPAAAPPVLVLGRQAILRSTAVPAAAVWLWYDGNYYFLL